VPLGLEFGAEHTACVIGRRDPARCDPRTHRRRPQQIGILHRRLLAIVGSDEVCRRLMTVPGVGGPVVALTYRATVDVPARFRKSKSVGAVFGLTPSRHQSGETDRPGTAD
jgi:transposase